MAKLDEHPGLEETSLEARLHEAALFEDVPPQLVSAAVAGSEVRELGAREVLLRAGSANTVLYILLSGRVSVLLPGTERPLVQLGAGECVGELSLLDGGQVSADVVAEEPTRVLVLDSDELWSLIDSSAEVARNLLRILAAHVRRDNAALAESDRQRSRLERLATVDRLTGLRNRAWLDDAFSRQVVRAGRTGQPVSLLMIDIDHFKRINDTEGHQAGDAVLRRVGQTLASGLRPVDLLARYGGEEFAVLLPGLETEAACAVGERLRLAIERDRSGMSIPTTVSVGVSSLGAGATLEALVKRADQALYRAKQSGRNRTCM
jgi:diguanylate cyclase (GGDEF)-like protein